MKFGDKFIKMIRKIYNVQTAKILVNGQQTENFEIQKGVRQGCPLSPLLFILSLEVLLEDIRKDPEVTGLKIKNQEYKLQAFADDLVLILDDPLKSGPKILNRIKQYGKVAGLKINKQKTKILTKNLTTIQQIELETIMEMQIAKKIKYLGIWMTNKLSTLKENNYVTLLKQINKDLEKWAKLQLSLFGKISAIKMNVLPRLLYLFRVIPINPGRTYFRDLEKLIAKFIWQGRKARIKLKYLQDKRERGGTGLPEWQIYHKASVLIWIREWIELKDRRILTLEGFDLLKGWHAYLREGSQIKHGQFNKHMVRNELFKTWNGIRKYHYEKLPRWISPLEAEIYPNVLDPNKIKTYQDLLTEEGNLKSLEQLKMENLEMDWLTYIQLRTRYRQDIDKYGIQTESNQLDKILLGNPRKAITKIYNYLLTYKFEPELVKPTMIAWATNFGHIIRLEDWEELWKRTNKLTLSTAYQENSFKMFHRWHLPPARIAKMFPGTSPTCWKCKNSKGTYYHMWWLCPKAKQYWNMIRWQLEQISGKKIPLEPQTFLLGIFTDKYDKELIFLLTHILTAARIIFAQQWKLETIPTTNQIINKIMECAEMDRLTREIQGKQESDYFLVWQRWYDWIAKYNDKTNT